MSEAFGNDYVVLTDEDGNEVEFQHIDTVEADTIVDIVMERVEDMYEDEE